MNNEPSPYQTAGAATRDRWVAIAAVTVLVILTGVVVGLVLQAQQAGIDTREELRLEQVNQQASAMDTRIQQAYTSLGAGAGAPGRWKMTLGDTDDAAQLAPTNPQATTGQVLVALDGTIVNGSLLRDPDAIGTEHTGDLTEVFAGESAILPVGTGYTTTDMVSAIALPVRDAAGNLAGAYLFEFEVSATSAFNQEIAALRAGDSGSFSFLDPNEVVVASSDAELIGRPFEVDTDDLAPGFRRSDGYVFGVGEVPSADWTLVFRQTTEEFEGDVTGPVRLAVLVLLVAVAIGGAVSVVALLRRLRAARDEQRRLAEISAAREEFTSIVSHELRTPVAGLLGFLQTTLDHWPEMGDDERRRAVSRAFHNAQRLQHLTADVLDTTSIEAGQITYEFEPVDLREVVAEAVDTVRTAAAGRTFDLQLPSDDVVVDADATRLQQVLTNLLDNALKSSPLDSPVEVLVTRDNGTASVTVRDRGSGVAPEERDRIFEKFTRGRTGLSRGSGLGLYIARQIIEAHRGRIWVDEVDGPGAALAFSLPTTTADRSSS